MEKPAVSVIVTIYNKEKYLEKCLNCLISQTLSKIEIILVNDGSKDNSLEICKIYASREPRIRIIDKKNEGVVNARIDGVRAAKGEYISIIDADDWLSPDYYEKSYDQAMLFEADVVITGYCEEHVEKTKRVSMEFNTGLYSGDSKNILYEKMIFDGNYYNAGINPSLWNKLIKAGPLLEFITQVDPCLTMGEDGAASYPILASANRIVIDNNNRSYHYRIEQGSLSRSYDADFLRKASILLFDLRKALNRSGHDFSAQIDYYAVFMIVYGIDQIAMSKIELSPFRKAKTLKDSLKYFDKNDIIRFGKLKDLPEKELLTTHRLAEGKYLTIISSYYVKTAIRKTIGRLRGN